MPLAPLNPDTQTLGDPNPFALFPADDLFPSDTLLPRDGLVPPELVALAPDTHTLTPLAPDTP